MTADPPIARTHCLATVWLNCANTTLDPEPTTCRLTWGHDGPHHAGTNNVGPEITWRSCA